MLLTRTRRRVDGKNPFFHLGPEWSGVPLVLLATSATIIASQAVISGAFSVTQQAIQLGFMPRLTIIHTSEQEIGQIYIPVVNWALWPVGDPAGPDPGLPSSNLASAYGIAVTGAMLIDAVLIAVVLFSLWKWPLARQWRCWRSSSGIDLALFRRQPPEDPRRRLVPAADRRDRSSPC